MTRFIGQNKTETKQRKFLNEVLIKKFAKMFGKKDKVFIIGCGINWDYREDFDCDLSTTEIDPMIKADIHDDICKSDIGTEFADGVLFNGMWESVENPFDAFHEIHRILKPDGRLLFGALFKMDSGTIDYWRLTPKGMKKLLKDCNFELLEFHNIDDIYLYAIAKKL